jgi:CxxC motif-containing protein
VITSTIVVEPIEEVRCHQGLNKACDEVKGEQKQHGCDEGFEEIKAVDAIIRSRYTLENANRNTLNVKNTD